MFEKVINCLEKQVRNFIELSNDKTGVLTQYTKDDYRNRIAEFEHAIAALKTEDGREMRSAERPREDSGSVAASAAHSLPAELPSAEPDVAHQSQPKTVMPFIHCVYCVHLDDELNCKLGGGENCVNRKA
jgi:hypothetical protein